MNKEEQNLDRKQRLEALKQRCQEASKELSSLQKPKKRKRTEEKHKNTEQETSKPSKELSERSKLFLQYFDPKEQTMYEKTEKDKEYEDKINDLIASSKIDEAERMSKEYSDYKYLRRVKEASNKVDYAIQQEEKRKKKGSKARPRLFWRFDVKERWQQKGHS